LQDFPHSTRITYPDDGTFPLHCAQKLVTPYPLFWGAMKCISRQELGSVMPSRREEMHGVFWLQKELIRIDQSLLLARKTKNLDSIKIT
jgi:hypothetical protein